VFETFTAAARRVLSLGAEESRALGHDHLGTEHLLLGLIAEGEGAAARSFARLGVTLEAARQQVQAELGGTPGTRSEGQLPVTPRARATLDAAPRQAMGLKDEGVDTEHILLALLIERDARTASILAALGCPPDTLRTTVLAERTRRHPDDDGDALVALARGDGVAARALAALGVTAEALAAAVERARGGS
jgi:ATP-dependent Clp protease ATP-binding subunit ClpC